MTEKFWEDFEPGFKITTRSITVTETHLVNWAGLTMDYYPLHMDKEFASKTRFGERLAHGPLIFGLAIGLVGLANIEGNAIVAWLGAENIRMIAPVLIGDTITVEAEVIDKKETNKMSQGTQTWQYTVYNQRSEKVMFIHMKFMMRRKKPASSSL